MALHKKPGSERLKKTCFTVFAKCYKMDIYKLEVCAKAIGVKPDEPGVDKAAEIIEKLVYERAHLIGEVNCHLTGKKDANKRLIAYFEGSINEVRNWHEGISHYGHTGHPDPHYHVSSKVARKLLAYLEAKHKKLKDYNEQPRGIFFKGMIPWAR